MNSDIQKGRTQVIAIIVTAIVTSLIGEVVTYFLPSDQSSSGMISIDIISTGVAWALTVALYYFLYQGHGWAKWVLGVLLATFAFIGISFALTDTPFSYIRLASVLILSAIDLIVSWVLLRSPQIKAFLSSQRAEQSR